MIMSRRRLTSIMSRVVSRIEIRIAIFELARKGTIKVYMDPHSDQEVYEWKGEKENGSGGENRGDESEGPGEAV
jgi:hypothetical protein